MKMTNDLIVKMYEEYTIKQKGTDRKMREEQEWCFNFRSMCLGVMATSKESAYGFMYSEYADVTEEELDDAYERGNQ